MRLSKRKRSTIVNPDMTPLIDVVFLLIIFFMTVTQATKANHQVLELPKLKGTAETNESMGAITVNIDKEGVITMAGREVSMAEARGIIAKRLTAAKEISVSLRVDRRSKSAWANDVIRALVELGVSRSRIAVQSSNPGGP